MLALFENVRVCQYSLLRHRLRGTGPLDSDVPGFHRSASKKAATSSRLSFAWVTRLVRIACSTSTEPSPKSAAAK